LKEDYGFQWAIFGLENLIKCRQCLVCVQILKHLKPYSVPRDSPRVTLGYSDKEFGQPTVQWLFGFGKNTILNVVIACGVHSVLAEQPPDTWDSFPLFQILNDYLRTDGKCHLFFRQNFSFSF
jgi:hypothetical protein